MYYISNFFLRMCTLIFRYKHWLILRHQHTVKSVSISSFPGKYNMIIISFTRQASISNTYYDKPLFWTPGNCQAA